MPVSINFISIRGSAQLLTELVTNPPDEFDLHEESVQRVAADTFEVGAYASDPAIAVLQARGLAVEVLMDTAGLQAHMAQLRAAASGVPPGPIA
jgi:hypothetical protein